MKGSLQQLQIKALALCCSLVVYFSGILGFKGRCKVRFWGALLRHPSLTISCPNAPLNLNLNNSYLPVRNGCDPPFLKLFFFNVGPFRKSCGFGSSKVSPLSFFFWLSSRNIRRWNYLRAKLGLCVWLLLKQQYMKDAQDCLDQSLWGEKDPTVGCSSQQQDVWIPACYWERLWSVALWTQPGFPFKVRGWVGLGQLREIFLGFLPPFFPLMVVWGEEAFREDRMD